MINDTFTTASLNLNLASHAMDIAEGGQSWTPTGPWQVNANGYAELGTSVAGSTLVTEVGKHTGFIEAEVDAKGTSSGDYGLVFNYKDADNYKRITLNSSDSPKQVVYERIEDGSVVGAETNTHNLTTDTSVNQSNLEGVHKIAVSWRTTGVYVFVDEALVFSHAFSSLASQRYAKPSSTNLDGDGDSYELYSKGGVWADTSTPHFNSFRHISSVEDADIIIASGQSNMQGGETIKDPDVDQYPIRSAVVGTNGVLHPAYSHLQHPNSTNSAYDHTTECVAPFARRYVEDNPERNIFIVPVSQASTGFYDDDWNEGDAYYDLLVDRTDYILGKNQGAQSGNLEGYTGSYNFTVMLWHQGEQDTNSTAAANAYESALRTFISDIRTRVENPNMLFLIGGMLPEFIGSDSDHLIVAAAHQTLGLEPFNGYIANDDGTDLVNGVHFSTESIRKMGLRFYLEYLRKSNPSYLGNHGRFPATSTFDANYGTIASS